MINRNIDALLKELNKGVLCKTFKEYSGNLLIREFIAHPQLNVGGSCILKSSFYIGTKLISESCKVGIWSQVMEDTISTDPTVFSNSISTNFDGIDEYIDFGNTFNYDIATAFSISMWVKPQNLAATRLLFSKAGGSPNVRGYMLRHNITTGALFLQMRSSGDNRNKTFTSTLTAGVWNHLVFTYAGGSNINGARVYVNSAVGDTPASGTLGGTMLEGQSFFIGQRNTGFFFSGNIDEFTVWDKALNQAEVTELYNAGAPNDPNDHSANANLVSSHDLAEFPTTLDRTGTDDGSLINMSSANLETDVP